MVYKKGTYYKKWTWIGLTSKIYDEKQKLLFIKLLWKHWTIKKRVEKNFFRQWKFFLMLFYNLNLVFFDVTFCLWLCRLKELCLSLNKAWKKNWNSQQIIPTRFTYQMAEHIGSMCTKKTILLTKHFLNLFILWTNYCGFVLKIIFYSRDSVFYALRNRIENKNGADDYG